MAIKTAVVALPRSLATKAKAATPGSERDRGSSLPKDRTALAFETVKQMRASGQLVAAIRKLATIEGTTSDAIFALVQVASSSYSFKAYDSQTHEFSPDGTKAARSVKASMDTLYDYTKGYADKKTFADMIETGLREVALTGAVAGELVLDQARLPSKVNLIPYEQLEWRADGKGGKYPVQRASGGEIELNIPNFWVAESHLEANTAYARSMMEAAVNTVFYYMEFVEDMRRAVRRAGHSRLIVKLDSEKVRAAAPAEIRTDDVAMQSFMSAQLEAVKTVVNALEPEDALVTYDSVSVDGVDAKGEKQDYKELLDALSGLLSTSLKSHPSILGLRLTGSQSLSNTESLVFLKIARAIQRPLEKLLSRALTLAVRLYGIDVYVKFRFNSIDIRPDFELEAFRTMRQDRILTLLSIGMLSDEEAAEELDLPSLPSGMAPLSGTFFKDMKSTLATQVSPNQDPQGRALQPNTPSKGGGSSQ